MNRRACLWQTFVFETRSHERSHGRRSGNRTENRWITYRRAIANAHAAAQIAPNKVSTAFVPKNSNRCFSESEDLDGHPTKNEVVGEQKFCSRKRYEKKNRSKDPQKNLSRQVPSSDASDHVVCDVLKTSHAHGWFSWVLRLLLKYKSYVGRSGESRRRETSTTKKKVVV